jgi:6-phosphogluconate dehydrogenase
MKIAIAGLGRMGMQIAHKLSADGHDVIAHNRTTSKIDEAVSYGATAAPGKTDVAKAFEGEHAVLWIMVPADAIEGELHEWLDVLPQGSIIIDGGNTDYRSTRKHAELVKSRGSTLLDCGTSGGVWGYERGFSMMIGGDVSAFKTVESAFQTLAKPTGGYQYFEGPGSGHYVKMVHNAIEYGMMESLAEGYRMLREGPYKGIDLAAAGEVWQHSSVVTSWLNELSRDALRENPTLAGIDGYVAESGEARWTLETAKDLDISLPAIQASFDVRVASQKGEVNFATKLLSAMRNKFGGHNLNK